MSNNPDDNPPPQLPPNITIPATATFPMPPGAWPLLHPFVITQIAPPPPEPEPEPEPAPVDVGYEPTAADIAAVTAMFASLRHTPLPPEIVTAILDMAEYWRHTTQSVRRGRDGWERDVWGSNHEDTLLIRCTPLGFEAPPVRDARGFHAASVPPRPLGRERVDLASFHVATTDGKDGDDKTKQVDADPLTNPCRKIVFTITSRDQGWGGQGAVEPHRGDYAGSYSWFEVGLERFDAEGECPADCPIDNPPANTPPASSADTTTAQASPAQPPSPPAPLLRTCSLRPVIPALESFVPPPSPAADEPPQLPMPGGGGGGDAAPPPPPPPPPVPAPARNPAWRELHQLHPAPRLTIQHNKTARRTPTTHRVAWRATDDIPASAADTDLSEDALRRRREELSAKGRGTATGDGSFVADLRFGDVVTVWAKCRFAGWSNRTDKVTVDVYYAV